MAALFMWGILLRRSYRSLQDFKILMQFRNVLFKCILLKYMLTGLAFLIDEYQYYLFHPLSIRSNFISYNIQAQNEMKTTISFKLEIPKRKFQCCSRFSLSEKINGADL